MQITQDPKWIDETRTLFQLVAGEGKVIARKSDGKLLGPVFHPGVEDSPDNYTEVDAPEPAPEDEE